MPLSMIFFMASDVAHSFDGIPGQIGGLAASSNAGEIDAVVIGLMDFPRRKNCCDRDTPSSPAYRCASKPEEGFLISARHTVDRHHEESDSRQPRLG